MDYKYFTFPELTYRAGCLCINKECQACFYYYMLVSRADSKIGEHIEDQFGLLEGNLWMDLSKVGIAKGVALIYGTTVEEMLRHSDHVIKTVEYFGMPEAKAAWFNLPTSDRIN